MEGGGIVSACERRSVKWLIVKGICDWAVGKNDKTRDKHADQSVAANNAFSFVMKILREGQL